MNVVDRVDNLEGSVVGVEVVCRSLILTGELRVIRIVVAGEEGSARGVNIIEVVVVVDTSSGADIRAVEGSAVVYGREDKVLTAEGAESDVPVLVSGLFVDGSDSVVHSCTSFHFTTLIDVLLMSYYSFLKDGTNVESPSPEGFRCIGAPLKFTI